MTGALGLPLVLEAIGGLLIAVFIGGAGFLLFSSAKSADDQITDGVAFIASSKTGGTAAGRPKTAAVAAAFASPDTPSDTFALLNTYYGANISQGNTIFWASLLSMGLGFAIIFLGVITANASGTTAIIAAIAGVLSQFIGATFLVVLRSTQQQSTAYAQSLVDLHLHSAAREADQRATDLGLRLLGEISADRTDPANTTKAAIAMGLIVKQTPGAPEAPTVAVEVPANDDSGVIERRNRSATVFGDTAGVERR